MKASEPFLPEHGIDAESVLKCMESYAADDADYRNGRTWSLVYYLGQEHSDFLKKAYEMFFSENGLNPMAFKSLKRFEKEVVHMASGFLNGDSEVCGCMTSGGTESCLLAVKTYRDMARAVKGIKQPEMIVPESVHVAFEKAAEYFGVKAVHAPLGKDWRVDVKAVRKLINSRTALIVASAPCYPFGVVDPVSELASIAARRNIPLHVDSCLGGFMLPFVDKLGYDVPLFDFRVAGVSSISADVHKYGFSAKGASLILYRNIDIMKHQIFVYENWPGGIFASPALLGTRPGGAIAAAWAAMQYFGMDGYLANAKKCMQIIGRLKDGINSIDGLQVIGNPHMTVMAYRSVSKDINIYAVGDMLEKRGWHIDRQQRPESLHLMVTPYHENVVEQYLGDLRASVNEVRGNPELATSGSAAVYGMISNIPLRGMVKKNVMKMMMDSYGPSGGDLSTDKPDDSLAGRLALSFLKMKEKIRRM